MRKRFNWKVPIQGEKGGVLEQPVSSYWDPEHATTRVAVAEAACAEARAAGGYKEKYVPVGEPVLLAA